MTDFLGHRQQQHSSLLHPFAQEKIGVEKIFQVLLKYLEGIQHWLIHLPS